MSLKRVEKYLLGATLFCIPLGTGALFSGVISADLVLLTDVFLVSLYGVWLYRTNLFSKQHLRLESLGIMAVLMTIWGILSMASAIALVASAIGIYFAIKSLLLYFYLINNIRTKEQLVFVANMLILALLFQGLVGTMQGALGRSLGLGFLGERQMTLHKVESRVRGTIGYPNRYGALLILILPLAISMAIFAKRSVYKAALIAASVFGVMGLFLSLSRASWAGFLLGMVIFAVLLFRRGLLKPKFVAAIFVMLLGLLTIVMVNWQKIQVRFEVGSDGRFRMRMIDIASDIIRESPIIGVGLNNYQWHSIDYFQFWHPVHNEFLRFAAETGIPGAIIFTVLIIVFLREAYRGVMLKDTLLNTIAIGIFCGVVAFVVAINIGPEYQHYRIKLVFWALAGMAFSLRRVKYFETKMKKRRQELQAQTPDVRARTVLPRTHLISATEGRKP